MNNETSQWRSVLVVMFLSAVLLGGLALAMPKANEQIVKLYDSFATALWILAIGLLTKSLGEKAAGGGGLKGMAKALLTDAKPDKPEGGTP
jgi:hypothetical protein